jgi:hypothetical protein
MKENKDIQPIDKLFRQSLEGYSPAPPPSVWKGVKAKLGSGRPSVSQFLAKNAGMIIVSSAILGVLAFLIFNAKTSLLPQSENVVSNAKNLSSETNQNSQNKPSKTYHINPSEKPTSVNEPLKTEIKAGKIKNSVNEGNKQLASNSANNPNTLAKPILKPALSESQNSNQPKKEENMPAVSNSVAETSVSLASVTAAPVSKPKTNESENNNFQLDKLQVATENHAENANKNTEPKNLQQSEITSEKQDFPASVSPGPDKIAAEPKAQSEGMTSTSGKEDKPGTTSPDQGKPEFGNSRKSNPLKYSVGVDGSYGKVIIGGLNPNDFYTVDALAGITFTKSKIGIETGIGLGYYKDRGIYNFEFLRTDTTGYVVKSLFNKYDSSYLIVYNPVTSNTTINVDTTTPLSYTYLRIPLYFSKQFFHFNKFNLGLKTGPNLELLITKKETLPEYSLSGTSLIGLQDNSFTMVSTSWQWLFAPQFSWDITDKIVFRLEPSVVFYLNNRYDSQNKPSSKPYGIGIWTGLRYNF